uniref:Uncharacterized protein n=1 Tax=Chromera velia CCMP2878 TaxID=1169474 RepID=A0A0G4F0G0_9ALVE|eukprot:Cvel_14515.t1-p1 / transcript=Cvel_14515.t1 / gene=Cvel_14515 / organism=Chromera_velia_CCMP2878 / gene_product=hypothetical protein / transcript_product=hypothetical protein / location=Cvel_scaffold1036:35822-37253(+) / protein_length=186 / sequence_SO=supercontig / SO=protein_coding / is_pseudo=false
MPTANDVPEANHIEQQQTASACEICPAVQAVEQKQKEEEESRVAEMHSLTRSCVARVTQVAVQAAEQKQKEEGESRVAEMRTPYILTPRQKEGTPPGLAELRKKTSAINTHVTSALTVSGSSQTRGTINGPLPVRETLPKNCQNGFHFRWGGVGKFFRQVSCRLSCGLCLWGSPVLEDDSDGLRQM